MIVKHLIIVTKRNNDKLTMITADHYLKEEYYYGSKKLRRYAKGCK